MLKHVLLQRLLDSKQAQLFPPPSSARKPTCQKSIALFLEADRFFRGCATLIPSTSGVEILVRVRVSVCLRFAAVLGNQASPRSFPRRRRCPSLVAQRVRSENGQPSSVGNEGMRALYVSFKGLYSASFPHSPLRTSQFRVILGLRVASACQARPLPCDSI